MKQYKTTAVLNLYSGNLKLDDEQLRRRRHLVSDNKDGTVAIVGRVQFKIGEEFGYDGDVPKNLAESLTEVKEKTTGAGKKKSGGKKGDGKPSD